jgi:hypothetical protein
LELRNNDDRERDCKLFLFFKNNNKLDIGKKMSGSGGSNVDEKAQIQNHILSLLAVGGDSASSNQNRSVPTTTTK